MNNQMTGITEAKYNLLPLVYNNIIRPQWGKPYIVTVNNIERNLNYDNLMNVIYFKTTNFNIDNENMNELPNYLNTLIGFLSAASNNDINIVGIGVNFFAETCDFSKFALRTQNRLSFLYHFGDIKDNLNDYYEIIMRLFVFYVITDRGPNRTGLYNHFCNIKKMFRFFYENGIYNLRFLTVKDIEMFFEKIGISYTTKYKYRVSLKYFLTIYSYLVEDIYSKELDNYLSDRDINLINAIVEENKAPLLPTEFFIKLEDVLTREFNKDTNSIKVRMIYGLLLLGMQTGLRVSELNQLEKSSLVVQAIDNKQIGVIKYYSAKGRINKERIATTLATPKAVAIYQKMIALDFDKKSKLLAFANPEESIKMQTIQSRLRHLCIDNCHELEIINHPNPRQFSFSMNCAHALNLHKRKMLARLNVKEVDIISLPTITQFRVYFASELRAIGVDDRHVSSFLGHTSSEMWGYYSRSAKEIQDEKQEVNDLLTEVIEGKANLLGPKGSALQAKMQNFIDMNKYNGKYDLKEVLVGLSNEVEIRVKAGGFCIHSNKRRTCQYDSDTDEFLCSYGCCPNHCHTYYSAPGTYSKFLDLIEVVEHNRKNGFNRQVEKEMKKMKAIITQELIPELNDLNFQLESQSDEEIIRRHPATKGIIENIDSIYGEINLWCKLIEENERNIKVKL